MHIKQLKKRHGPIRFIIDHRVSCAIHTTQIGDVAWVENEHGGRFGILINTVTDNGVLTGTVTLMHPTVYHEIGGVKKKDPVTFRMDNVLKFVRVQCCTKRGNDLSCKGYIQAGKCRIQGSED